MFIKTLWKVVKIHFLNNGLCYLKDKTTMVDESKYAKTTRDPTWDSNNTFILFSLILSLGGSLYTLPSSCRDFSFLLHTCILSFI